MTAIDFKVFDGAGIMKTLDSEYQRNYCKSRYNNLSIIKYFQINEILFALGISLRFSLTTTFTKVCSIVLFGKGAFIYI